MGKMKKIAAWVLTVVMICSMIVTNQTTKTNAATKNIWKQTFGTPSGLTIKEDDLSYGAEVKGVLKEGESTFEIKTKFTKTRVFNADIRVNYNKTEDEAYNQSIEGAVTTFQIKKAGKSQYLYDHNTAVTEFEENDTRTSKIKMTSYEDAPNGQDYDGYHVANAILRPGIYTITYTLPEKVTKGAKIYFQGEASALTDEEDGSILVANHTKKTAKKIKVPYDEFEDDTLCNVFRHGTSNTTWYKATLPAKRSVYFEISTATFERNQKVEISLYKGSKLIKKYTAKSDSEVLSAGQYEDEVDIDRTLEKGTYYLKIQAAKDVTGYCKMDVDIEGPARPKVTTPKAGAKIIKGTSEPGSTVYAVINKKTYKAAKKTNSKGAFSVKVPTLKAGTKVKVYMKDAVGAKSSSRTVTVKK